MTRDRQPEAREVYGDPLMLAAFGFGTGLSPRAPGTAGTVVGVPLFVVMLNLSPWSYLALTVLLFVAGIGICGYAARKLGVHDHGGIVWDEIVGYLVTMLPVLLIEPDAAWMNIAWAALIGFVLFRIFDIAKPPPIRWADHHLQGGFGIMFDDLLAGIYAAALMAAVLYFL